MILMTNGKKKKFVADALVSTYEKKGFIAVTKPVEASEDAPEETAEEANEETTTAKKTSSRKKTAE